MFMPLRCILGRRNQWPPSYIVSYHVVSQYAVRLGPLYENLKHRAVHDVLYQFDKCQFRIAELCMLTIDNR